MSENESRTPFGPGFIAACVVIVAVVVCGIVVLVAGGGSETTPVSSPAAAAHEEARGEGGDAPRAPATPADDCAAAGYSVGCTSAPAAQSTCSLPAGDQTVPATAPVADGWDLSRRVAVPRSAAFGPGVIDRDGFRRCFAHSPTGAVFAAYNVLAALADQTKAAATARKLMLPGAETDKLLRELAAESPSTESEPTQLAGYRILAANRDQVTAMLAVPVEAQYMSLTVTMVWHDRDWRLQPPPPGDAVGAPFVQVRSLADFVKWSGL